MRRPIINTNVEKKVDVTVAPRQASRTTVELTGMALDKRLRQKRSQAYVECVTKLDAGGVTCSQAQIDELIQAIQDEFPDLTPHQFPLGIIARCYLGKSFEVHTLDITLAIVEHYRKGEILPSQMDRARGIALHPSYAFIEVYNDRLHAVTNYGDVAVIQG